MNQHELTLFSQRLLSICHILLLTASNILVQYPFTLFGFHTTWGAFTYPAIFILTDLTVRLSTSSSARHIIFRSMFPGLLISYFVASFIETSNHFSWNEVFTIHIMPLRIAMACFIAYVMGQLLDILVFQQFKYKKSWWLAPTFSTTIGNIVDTLLFFTIAFYQCSNPFLSEHWPEIALVDIFFKITISLIAFVPIYGVVLNLINMQFTKKSMA